MYDRSSHALFWHMVWDGSNLFCWSPKLSGAIKSCTVLTYGVGWVQFVLSIAQIIRCDQVMLSLLFFCEIGAICFVDCLNCQVRPTHKAWSSNWMCNECCDQHQHSILTSDGCNLHCWSPKLKVWSTQALSSNLVVMGVTYFDDRPNYKVRSTHKALSNNLMCDECNV